MRVEVAGDVAAQIASDLRPRVDVQGERLRSGLQESSANIHESWLRRADVYDARHTGLFQSIGERWRGQHGEGQQDWESPRRKSSSERVSERTSENLREVLWKWRLSYRKEPLGGFRRSSQRTSQRKSFLWEALDPVAPSSSCFLIFLQNKPWFKNIRAESLFASEDLWNCCALAACCLLILDFCWLAEARKFGSTRLETPLFQWLCHAICSLLLWQDQILPSHQENVFAVLCFRTWIKNSMQCHIREESEHRVSFELDADTSPLSQKFIFQHKQMHIRENLLGQRIRIEYDYMALDHFWAHILLKNAIFPSFIVKKWHFWVVLDLLPTDPFFFWICSIAIKLLCPKSA